MIKLRILTAELKNKNTHIHEDTHIT